MSLVVLQRARCRTLWCLSTAFSWLEAERAFYNPDLGSGRSLLAHISDIKAAQLQFSVMIVMRWTICRGGGGSKVLFWWDFSVVFLSFRLFDCTVCLLQSLFPFPFMMFPADKLLIPSPADVSKGILMAALELLRMCSRYYAVLFS